MENWLPIVGYESHYAVSDHGRIKSLRSTTNTKVGRIVKGVPQGGYIHCTLTKPGEKTRRFQIHRLVAIAFIGNPTQERPYINHKDGNGYNNRVENLEWCSQKENIQHALKVLHRATAKGEQKHGRFKEKDVIDIRQRHSHGESSSALAMAYNSPVGTILDIICRRTWKHLP